MASFKSLYSILFCIFALLCNARAQTANTFQADITITGDPQIQGIMTGVLWYDSASSVQRIDYSLPSGVVSEIVNFTVSNRVRYLKCATKCNTQAWPTTQLKFYSEASDVAASGTVTVDGQVCNRKNKASGEVVSIWVTSTNKICRAQERNGKVWTFNNVRAVTDRSVFTAFTGWNCPQQQCWKPMDIVLVFDESGSIEDDNWAIEKDFARKIVDSYQFGAKLVNMGFALFDTDARIASNLTASATNMKNTINYVEQGGTDTCIGCGIRAGLQVLSGSTRTGVTKVIILVTDGDNNVYTYSIADERKNAINRNVAIFAVGVDGTSVNSLKKIATNDSNVFFTKDWSKLKTFLDSLVQQTCDSFPEVSNCGASCLGFCGCDQVCSCPSTCSDNNACTTDSCAAGVNGNGCTYKTVTCDDKNLCTENKCDPSRGCVFPPISCGSGDACNVVTCDPASGCSTVSNATRCYDGDDCTSDTCDPSSGCPHTKIPCDLCKNRDVTCPKIDCKINSCDPADGLCKSTDFDCDDHNECTIDACSNDTCTHTPVVCDDNDLCTVDSCSATEGCVFTPINATLECDDYSVCTNDTCQPLVGCVNIFMPCAADNNSCTDKTCDPIQGCLYETLDCLTVPEIAEYIGDCQIAVCDSSSGCLLQPLPGAVIDKCGVCNGNGAKCATITPQEAAGIAGGVIAGIVIASLVGAAALGFGAKKGYDALQASSMQSGEVNNNPLYQDANPTSENPLFEGANV